MRKEDFTVHANAIVGGYNDLKKVWAVVSEVAKEMNGKVINKRFTDAINAKCEGVGRVYIDEYKKLLVYITNRCYNNGSYCVYFDDKLSYRYSFGVDFSGRVDADLICGMVSANIKNINDKISTWKDAAKNWDKYEAKVRKALEAFNKAMVGVNPLFKPYELHSFQWERPESYCIFNK